MQKAFLSVRIVFSMFSRFFYCFSCFFNVCRLFSMFNGFFHCLAAGNNKKRR